MNDAKAEENGKKINGEDAGLTRSRIVFDEEGNPHQVMIEEVIDETMVTVSIFFF